MFSNTSTSYGSVAKFFHWFIALLVILMLLFGYLLDEIPKDFQSLAYNTHKLTGVVILFLMSIRALWALINPKPELPMNTLFWEKSAEVVGQMLLYVLVIAMPLAGWIGAVAGNRPPHLGNFKFLLPVPQNKALVKAAFNVHGTVAIALIVLISIHVLAALYHHFIKRDDILSRMLLRRD
jgi:cytochrome b561